MERNIFHDIYDSALTAQGGPTFSTGRWSNIAFRNNLVYFCNQSVEFWSDGEPGRDPGLSTGGRVQHLPRRRLWLVIGGSARPGHKGSLAHVRLVFPQTSQSTKVSLDAHTAYRFSASPTPGLHCAENVIYQRGDRPFQSATERR